MFKGVPYAAPPVGDGRWRAPGPVGAWRGVRAATAFGPSCPQPGAQRYPTSEDCLFLNVWTAASRAGERRPVMVWIHGGWFVTGSGSSRAFSGEHLARKGVVVVTLNYRLGAFGFMAHPELSRESGCDASGNYGLMDMLAALDWVRTNIDRFGGDPSRVTLFGESAGASAVAHLLTSPLAAGLFHRAILQSAGTSVTPLRLLREPWHGVEPAESLGARFVRSFPGGGGIDAMRQRTPEDILAQQHGENVFRAITDGFVLPEMPRRVLDAGRQLPVPLIVGCNADEGGMFLAGASDMTPDQYSAWLRERYGDDAPRVRACYPAKTTAEVRHALERIRGDGVFLMNARAMARFHHDLAPVFQYRFTRRPETDLGRTWGAYHAAEIPYVFGTLAPEDRGGRSLSETMMGCWVRFAETGDPNQAGLPAWPSFDPRTDQYLEFGDEVGLRTEPLAEALNLFERHAMRPDRAR